MFDEGTIGIAENALLPLQVRGLRLSIGSSEILQGVDLDLTHCGCTVVMGPNGAGKTQFLKAIHGLTTPQAGSIDWNGRRPASARLDQALVFQKPVLLRRSVAANIDFVLRARGWSTRATPEHLRGVGLEDKARLPARLLSGGEAQRLALARALALRPKVLLLDEPTANLDPAATLQIEQIVLKTKNLGIKVIFITHDVGQARRLADEVVFFHQGRVAAQGIAPEFWDTPPSPAVQDFLAGMIVRQ